MVASFDCADLGTYFELSRDESAKSERSDRQSLRSHSLSGGIDLQQLSTQEWMKPQTPGQKTYKTTSSGNVALRKLLAAKRAPRDGENKENMKPAANLWEQNISLAQKDEAADKKDREKSVEMVKQVNSY